MKKLAFLTLLIAAASMACMAQQTPAADVSAGYSYFHIGGSGSTNQNGASGSFAYNLNQSIGAVADFGGYHSSPGDVGLTTYTYMFGPRFSYRADSRFTPFAQILLGGAHETVSAFGTAGGTNAFAYSFGAGVDFPLTDRLAFRPQVDYVALRSSGSTTSCARISAAIVFHFGER
jgi:opacity protein-like surface antigen